jgi:hypothetical protein
MTPRQAQVVEVWQKHGGNVSAAAKELGVTRSTVYNTLQVTKVALEKPLAGGKIEATKTEQRSLPRSGIRRYILTSAQSNTLVHEGLWANLLALQEHYGAELLVASYTYNKNAYGSMAVKPGTADPQDVLWFDPKVVPLLEKSDTNIELAPGLVWCGRMNTLPTASRPLTGFETYTGRKSGIFPHAKLAMESVASGKTESTKFNYTTGTVTQRNYIQKTAGLRAEHHHSYGALLVEVDSDGRWFVRQLAAHEDGVLHDLDMQVKNGVITTGHRLEAITWGDVHEAMIDITVKAMAFGSGGMLDELRPKFQFLHDLVDFRARNHHEIRDPHKRFERHLLGQESVEAELNSATKFLWEAHREWVQTVVVDSNHDNAYVRWLKEADWRSDPVNALFFLESQYRILKSIKDGEDFHAIEWAMRRAECPAGVKFLREDESFVICRDAHGGIECGIHGHLGPNGSQGSPRALSKAGRKANTGHTHSAGIIDGLYTAGTSSKLDMGYNRGPSSWSHSHILTYQNGKRAIVTMWEGAWRAE